MLWISSYNCSLWQRTEICQAEGPQVTNLPGKPMLIMFQLIRLQTSWSLVFPYSYWLTVSLTVTTSSGTAFDHLKKRELNWAGHKHQVWGSRLVGKNLPWACSCSHWVIHSFPEKLKTTWTKSREQPVSEPVVAICFCYQFSVSTTK